MAKKLFWGFFKTLLVALFWLLIWAFAADRVGKELLLPSPISVFERLIEIAGGKDFYITTLFSLLRVTLGIIFATVLGILLAVITHTSGIADALARPLITVVKATPVASFIILALLWIDRGRLPIFISLMMVLPIMWTNLRTGLKEIDKGLLKLCKVYKIGFFKTVKDIYIPSTLPYFTSAAKTSLGLAWKAGIAAEVLAVPTRSIGKELFNSKAYFETTDLFAWTFVVIVLSLIIELVFEAAIGALRRGVGKEKRNA